MADLTGFTCEVGAARSGTNFLGELLSQHPDLAYWRRPKYIWRHGNAWKPDDCLTADDATPRIRRFIHKSFGDFLDHSGRKRLLVCTQSNSLGLEFVHAVFPEGKIIHIIRDGREVAPSQEQHWSKHNNLRGGEYPSLATVVRNRIREVPLTDIPAYAGEFVGNLYNTVAGKKYRYSMGPKIKDWKRIGRELDRLEYCAVVWRECVTAAREVGKTLPADQYMEVKFEDLVSRPEETVPKLLEFMDLPSATEIDEFIERKLKRTNSGKWLKRLSTEQMDRVMPIVGDLCAELGYV